MCYSERMGTRAGDLQRKKESLSLPAPWIICKSSLVRSASAFSSHDSEDWDFQGNINNNTRKVLI